MGKPHVVILGAGPAGLGAASQLVRRKLARVTVLERNPSVGGNAGSFQIAGQPVDFGSHRLHPACHPEIMRDLRELLGDDLLNRPRHGRIRLRGRWIHFPLKPADLALRLPPTFAAGVVGDVAAKLARGNDGGCRDDAAETFASVLQAGLGRTICRDFYFPYAQKIWGADPETLAAEQARRRVAAGSVQKMVRKVLTAVPGLKPPGAGRFFYPRYGFGQISEALAAAAQAGGADLRTRANVLAVERPDAPTLTVRFEQNGQVAAIDADYVWSTLPITALARCLRPDVPESLLAAAEQVRYRGMILVYLVLDVDRFSAYDAHYFPSADVPITRLSEPKNYSGGHGPRGQTVLCAEIPCSPGDETWAASDACLGYLVGRSLHSAGIPLQTPIRQIVTRRLSHAYPIYDRGYARHVQALDAYLGDVDGLLTFGRQGLFAHDNTHHALYMAYSAVDCLDHQGCFDADRWGEYRRIFETHLVED